MFRLLSWLPRWLLKLALLVPVLALLLAGFAMYAAWDHNPQNVFHDESGLVHWENWLPVGISWLVAGMLVFTPLYLAVVLAVAGVRAVLLRLARYLQSNTEGS